MDVSIPVNLSTNAWNIIKFLMVYLLLDATIPFLLSSIDKSSILTSLTRKGRVSIAKFTKDRHARSGVGQLFTLIRRRFRNRGMKRRPTRSLQLRPILLFSIWAASLLTEYGSGSQPNITRVLVESTDDGRDTILQAMLTCVQAHRSRDDPVVQLTLRNGTATTEGVKCSCSFPTEVGCTLPVHVERIYVTSTNIGSSIYHTPFFNTSSTGKFSFSGPVHVEQHDEYVLAQSRGKCNICSHQLMGPVDDILFTVYGTVDHVGNLRTPAIYVGNLTTGTLAGWALGLPVSPNKPVSTLDDLFMPLFTVSLLQGVWERPGWKNRTSTSEGLADMLEAVRSGVEHSPEFSAIWTAWWLRGSTAKLEHGTAILNTSSTETATISLLGIIAFAYMIVVFLVLLVCGFVQKRGVQNVKTKGHGNAKWLISALIAQQQVFGSRLRGVDDLEQFDLTIVQKVGKVRDVSAKHWEASCSVASPTSNLDVIDDAADYDDEENSFRQYSEMIRMGYAR